MKKKNILAIALIMVITIIAFSGCTNKEVVQNEMENKEIINNMKNEITNVETSDNVKDKTKNSNSEEEAKFEIDRYKLLGNTKYNIFDSFSYEFYKELIDKIYNYESTIIVDRDDIDVSYYEGEAITNNIFIDLLVESSYLSEDGKTLTIEYVYNSKDEHEAKLNEAENIVKNVIINSMSNNANELEKAIYVYTYWASNIEYDYSALNEDRVPTIYDVLFEHKGICQNYARMIDYTLNQMGMECYRVAGDIVSGEAHEWNLVNIYGDYYQIDATFENGETKGKGLNYFGLTKQDMLKEGRTFSPWVDGFVYDDFSDKESDKLKILKNTNTYNIDNHILKLYEKETSNEYAKINTETLEIVE